MFGKVSFRMTLSIGSCSCVILIVFKCLENPELSRMISCCGVFGFGIEVFAAAVVVDYSQNCWLLVVAWHCFVVANTLLLLARRPQRLGMDQKREFRCVALSFCIQNI